MTAAFAILLVSFVRAAGVVVPSASAATSPSSNGALRAGGSPEVEAAGPTKMSYGRWSTLAFRRRTDGDPVESPKNVMELLRTVPNQYNRIAFDVEYHGTVEQLLSLPMRRPRVVNLALAVIESWLADMLVQVTVIWGKAGQSIDWRRSAAFAAFGFFYIGLVQWALYVSVMTRLCPNAITFSNEPLEAKMLNFPGQLDLIKQIFIDNFIFEVWIYFPVFYVIKELVASNSKEPVADGLRKYKDNFWSDNGFSMMFWIPGDCFVFAAPIFLRLPIDHGISFVWTMVLSYRRGASGTTLATAKPGYEAA